MPASWAADKSLHFHNILDCSHNLPVCSGNVHVSLLG